MALGGIIVYDVVFIASFINEIALFVNMNEIVEGKARINVYLGKVSKKLPVFYNPNMKLNRDISISLINALGGEWQIALPLAGSGVRGIRMLKECENVKVSFNDYNVEASELIMQNLQSNGVTGDVFCKDAELFLQLSTGFNYIDIDPFGSPNFLLDIAVKRLSRGGILAVTATDTSALSGTYPKACMRKYWAKPLRNELMHEIGVRILARKVQLIAAQYEKALVPVFSHSSLHYMRVYFKCTKGKKHVDEVLKQHGLFKDVGPMWLGQLWDKDLVARMSLGSLSVIKDECQLDVVGFYDIHRTCKRLKISVPKMSVVVAAIEKAGYKVSATHFNEYGVRTDMPEDEFLRLVGSC